MTETMIKLVSYNFKADKAEKYNGWAAMIGIIPGVL